jgi:hydrogenase expression/formation protein HypE
MAQIKLADGNGGEENAKLINDIFYSAYANDILRKNEDAAVIDGGRLAMTTDSFTVSPIFFSGGDIGKISVCGTCNDLAMMAARPKYLTCAVMIEEGFDLEELKTITASIKKELDINGAIIVSGDTKIVPKGSVDKIFINTTGIGEIIRPGLSANAITGKDAIIVSASIGRHGAAIFANREGIDISSTLQSDCASLWPVVEKLIESGIAITAMRDATRGGVAAVLNEWAKQSDVCIEIDESAVPVCDEVQGICELLGFEAYNLANEGTFVLALPKENADKALAILHAHELGREAALIGGASARYPGKVVLKSPYGTSRFLDLPTGELLPRIC